MSQNAPPHNHHQCQHGCSHEHEHEHDNDDNHHDCQHHHHTHENHWQKAIVGLLWGAAFFLLPFFAGAIPFFIVFAAQVATSLVTLYLGKNLYKAALKELKSKEISTASLYTISTLTILMVSTLGLFFPALPAITEAAPLILGIWHLGEALENLLVKKIQHKLDVRSVLPKAVSLIHSLDEAISIHHLKLNDEFFLKNGQAIPVDGILLTDTWLYTTRIDGSPYLKHFKKGEQVRSGMQLAENTNCQIKVTQRYQDSYLSLVAKDISKADETKAPIEKLTHQILKWFVPSLLIIATVSGILVGTLVSPAAAFTCVVSVLVSACPCVLSLITPLAIKIGRNKGAKYGIQYSSGQALQASADIDTVVFDLNGTLTEGKPEVTRCFLNDQKLAPFIYALETQSNHPIANTINQYFKSQSIEPLAQSELSNIDKSQHNGISATIKGEKLIIGNRDLLKLHGIDTFTAPFDDEKKGGTFIAYQGKIVGQISITDPLRQDAKKTIATLKKQGKEIFICTGADKTTAKRYAQALDIPLENICANTVGAANSTDEISKQSFIQKLQKQKRKVAMVGDASNDLAAIRQADLGIAVHSTIGDSLTQNYADIIIQQGQLLPIAGALEIGQQTKKSIWTNLSISLTYNSIITMLSAGALIGLGAAFIINPIFGVFLTVIESSIVLGNIWLLKNQAVKAHEDDIKKSPKKMANSTTKMMDGLNNNNPITLTPKPRCGCCAHHKPFTVLTKCMPTNEETFEDKKQPQQGNTLSI